MYTPNCHTQGDVYVHFTGSGIVAAGDLFFPDEIPYVDLLDNGTVVGYAARIRSFIKDFPDDVVFIAAHGRAYSKDDLREYDHMLTETTRLIQEAAAAGKAADEMIQDSLLADWEEWRGQFATTSLEAWIQTVFIEATGGLDSRPSVCEPLTQALVEGDVEDAIRQYHDLKATEPDTYNFGEEQLNILGYQLIARQRIDDAAEVFRLNAEAYPESFNVYDSYGEALMLKGDTAQSIVNYEKSLELNPDNTNATEMLKRLNAE
ncbi:MAG: hypothetical protein JSU65_12045 [Candidatus Zixiibacteriota bacterium]|nr:MAG: hypothetical protein JSU65_12045 [candidate division Zixibacteria bacterium]